MTVRQSKINTQQLNAVLATDCGSTTTKAILFERTDKGWRSTCRGEAPTTVEKPVADVTIGVVNAFREIEELSGRRLIRNNFEYGQESSPLIIRDGGKGPIGVDLYVSTSSAGGGLQMVVVGVVAGMTAESAHRAALGAGAIVMDSISIDDGREHYERVQKIRHLRPDMILIAGGTEGGTVDHPLELAETILQAEPRPRFGDTLQLPVIYAANSASTAQAKRMLESHFDFVAVDNIRPVLERENLAPARGAIHELFLNHVMSHAPGYKKLMAWSPIRIIPTPAGFGEMVSLAANRWQMQIVAVDIGGATTDVFSVFNSHSGSEEKIFNRTVSANLGMSYSIANVLLEAGEENIQRWLPFSIRPAEMRDRLRNKMIRPTSIPETLEDLFLEQAICREALSLAFEHHKRLAVGLKGVISTRSIGDMFAVGDTGSSSLVNMMALDLIIGSGGVLSHAPDRKMAALMMVDAFQPEGVTKLAVDSIFMMPHLGAFSVVYPEAAAEIFVHDCLVNLGTVVAPIGNAKASEKILQVILQNGEEFTLRDGELRSIPIPSGESMNVSLAPLKRSIDVGGGKGKPIEIRAQGGPAGLILDGRGRPIKFPKSEETRISTLQRWFNSFNLNFS